MKEDRVLQALRALAEYDGAREAPPETEERLRQAFHSRAARHGRRWPAIAAVAAGIVIIAFFLADRPSKPVLRTALPAVSPAIQAVQPAPPAVAAVAARKPARRLAPARRAEPREVVTDFFPLMNPAPPFERGQLLRVQLPAAAMQAVGLPVREENLSDPIQADVLVGEEGMPRAIRFVRFDVQ